MSQQGPKRRKKQELTGQELKQELEQGLEQEPEQELMRQGLEQELEQELMRREVGAPLPRLRYYPPSATTTT